MTDTAITRLDIIQRIFSNWTALRMAVEHGMGSIDRAYNFCEFVADTLNMNERLHYTDISDELEDYMDSQFNTRLEDESEKQVAEDLVKFHNYFIQNDMERLAVEFEKLPPLKPWIVPGSNFKIPVVSKNGDSDDDNSEDEQQDGEQNEVREAPNNKPSSRMEVDEDGFTVVRRKAK